MIIISTIPCNALSWVASLGWGREGLPTSLVWEFVYELHRRAGRREGGGRDRGEMVGEEKCDTVQMGFCPSEGSQDTVLLT